jgi:predicted NAD/FAD-dependent oxidoreductase
MPAPDFACFGAPSIFARPVKGFALWIDQAPLAWMGCSGYRLPAA